MAYCKACAQKLFDDWKGVPWQIIKKWPRQNRRTLPNLPKLPVLEDLSCPSCSHSIPLRSDHIGYVPAGIPGPGIPEYWAIVTLDEDCQITELTELRRKWGHPYPDDFDDQQRRLKWKQIQQDRNDHQKKDKNDQPKQVENDHPIPDPQISFDFDS